MDTSKKITPTKSDTKKKTRKQVQKKLETALAMLKPLLGEKKFKRRIKKAGKVLTTGLKKNVNGNHTLKSSKVKLNAHKPIVTSANS